MLTRRQQEIYEFLRESIDRNGYAPSLEEIASHFDLSSVATIHEHLKNLERKNMIRRDFNRNRAIEVLPVAGTPRAVDVRVLGRVAAGRPIEAVEVPESVALPEEMMGKGETFVLRVQGDSMIDEFIKDGDLVVVEARDSASNGETVIALVYNDRLNENAAGSAPASVAASTPAASTAGARTWTVTGNAQRSAPTNGQRTDRSEAAIVDDEPTRDPALDSATGEVTLKRFYREGDRVRLQPANPNVAPLVLPDDQVRVQGVVIGVIRKYRS